jgi:hypothetical protein
MIIQQHNGSAAKQVSGVVQILLLPSTAICLQYVRNSYMYGGMERNVRRALMSKVSREQLRSVSARQTNPPTIKVELSGLLRGRLAEAEAGKTVNVTRMTKEERRQFLKRT